MRTDVLMVSYAKDLPFAEYAFKAAHKFAHGFGNFVCVVPDRDVEAFRKASDGFGVTVRGFDEVPGKGMLHHMIQKMRADAWCPDADAILHLDSDCIFWDHCTPVDFMVDGKPIVYRELFEDFRERHPYRYGWKVAVMTATGIDLSHDCMTRHPCVFLRSTYGKARQAITSHTGYYWSDYVISGPNSYPQEFCEHNSLAAVAMEKQFDQYHWVDFKSDGDYEYVRGRDFLKAFWSHEGVDASCDRHPGRTAREVIEEILK